MPEAIGSVSTKGQITIPQEIREQLGIRPGDKVWISVEESRVIVRPADMSLEAGYRSIPALKRPLTNDEMDELLDREALEDFKRSVSRQD